RQPGRLRRAAARIVRELRRASPLSLRAADPAARRRRLARRPPSARMRAPRALLSTRAMRRDRPSTTASAVAFARAVATLPGSRAPSSDPLAKSLLHPGLGALLRALEPVAARTRALDLALRVGSAGLVDHLALRTAAIDAALEELLAAGPRQLVVLGAGLDARAYRLRGVEDAAVFEVDHPATQRFKRDRARSLRPRARELRWVAVDFERERLADRLAAEGHDASAPTVWLWEGVVQYLEPAATRATLEQIRARSARRSALALTYNPSHDQPWLALARP